MKKSYSSLFLADPVCLLAPTLTALEKLIGKCTDYCRTYGLSFNPKKSKIMVFSKSVCNIETIRPIFLDGSKIDYVSEIKYLGTTIVSSPTFAYSSGPDLRSFYRSANSILNVRNKPNVLIQMHLLFNNCIPTLSFACAVKEFPAREMLNCNTAVNDAIRKIFSYERWESVRLLRKSCGFKSITEIFAEAKKKFQDYLPHHRNPVINQLGVINQVDQ